jgi:hypothetical protein
VTDPTPARTHRRARDGMVPVIRPGTRRSIRGSREPGTSDEAPNNVPGSRFPPPQGGRSGNPLARLNVPGAEPGREPRGTRWAQGTGALRMGPAEGNPLAGLEETPFRRPSVPLGLRSPSRAPDLPPIDDDQDRVGRRPTERSPFGPRSSIAAGRRADLMTSDHAVGLTSGEAVSSSLSSKRSRARAHARARAAAGPLGVGTGPQRRSDRSSVHGAGVRTPRRRISDPGGVPSARRTSLVTSRRGPVSCGVLR